MNSTPFPVAPATGPTNDMSDIIDSLKRLERVGSENSKTTQKLIDAARELASLITQQCGLPNFPDSENIILNEDRLEPFAKFQYFVANGRLVNGKRSTERHNAYVDETRDDALAFSKDVANGLLDYIVRVIEERQAESTESLSTLQDGPAEMARLLKAKKGEGNV